MIFFNKPISFYLQIFLATLLLGINIVVIVTLNHGYDLTDEGYFLLDYKNVNIYRGGIHNYHIVITKLTHWFKPQILEYRWMTLVLTLFSSLILAIGFDQWLKANYKIKNVFTFFWLNFCFISIGNFLYYFPGFQIIHNNTLTNFYLQVSTGLILYLFSLKFDEFIFSKINVIILGLIGLLTGFNFFIKFTTSILVLVSYILVLLFYYRKMSFKNLIRIFSTFFIGTILGVFIYFAFFQSYTEWRSNFIDAYYMLSDHKPQDLIAQYFDNIFSCFIFYIKYFSWLLVFPLYFYFENSKKLILKSNYKKNILNGIGIIALIFFLAEMYYFKFYKSVYGNPFGIINGYFYVIVILFQMSIILAIAIKKKKLTPAFININANKLILLLLLFITPFLGAFGTANSLFLNVLIHIAPWFIIIIILLIELSIQIKNTSSLSLLLLLPSCITFSQIAHGCLFEPFNSPGFFKTTEKIDQLPAIKGIYVDKNLKKSLLELNSLLRQNKFKDGYPIFGYSIPGIVYALGAISPGMPHYFNREPRDSISMNRFKYNNNAPVIIINDDNEIDKVLLATMKTKSIFYPEEYFFVGEVEFCSPYFKKILKVYFPKALCNKL